MKTLLHSLFEYGDWVNQRLLQAAEGLSQEEFTRDLLPGFGSIHHTFAHILGAEALWFERWQGRSPKTMLSPGDLPDVQSLRARWAELTKARDAFFAQLNESALNETVHWTNMRGQSYALPLWQIMLHCANHSTHHRSEIAAMLSMLGREPESTDLLGFYLERAGAEWKPSGRS